MKVHLQGQCPKHERGLCQGLYLTTITCRCVRVERVADLISRTRRGTTTRLTTFLPFPSTLDIFPRLQNLPRAIYSVLHGSLDWRHKWGEKCNSHCAFDPGPVNFCERGSGREGRKVCAANCPDARTTQIPLEAEQNLQWCNRYVRFVRAWILSSASAPLHKERLYMPPFNASGKNKISLI